MARPAEPVRRALELAWTVGEAIADEVLPVALGTALRTPSLPAAYSVNVLRIEGSRPHITLDAVAEAAEAARAPGVRYVHARVEDEPTGERLAAAAVDAPGWTVEPELLMLLDGPPRHGDPALAREGTLEEVDALIRTWYAEEGKTGDELEDVCAMSARGHRALDERRFLADHDGRPAAMCSLRRRGGVAQLEDVYVRPEARGRGLGAAVVAAAAEAAVSEDHGVVFIFADPDDWPKDLYARVGFAPAARPVVLHRGHA